MKRLFLISITLFFVMINTFLPASCAVVNKELKIPAQDGFNIVSTLSYTKVKGKKDFKTVVLLHSLGYNSAWWGTLPTQLLNNGYAVLQIDLRGHGKSIYNKKLVKTSWKNLTNNAYAKYPSDIEAVMSYIKQEYPKKHFFNNWCIVGSDIGTSAGIIAADEYKGTKPKTIIMLSPVTKTKTLFVPIHIAQLDNVDFLAILGHNEVDAQRDSKYLKKFAQGIYTEHVSKYHSSGMVLLKNDPDISKLIIGWIKQYL